MLPRFPIWLFIGAIGLAVIVGAVMTLSRSNTPRAETLTPTIAATILPTDTPALVGSPTTVSSTETPQHVAVPGNTFRDEFENQLAEGWTWQAEDQALWSLTEVPGWLQILASDASFDGPSFPTNVLLRRAPAGDFEITTLLRFAPTSNYQFAGLVVFQDKANVLQFGRGFCDLPDACVGEGIYFDNFEGGFIVENHKAPIRVDEIYLRLRRAGNTYSGYYSEDGEHWTLVGEHEKDFSQAQIGLMAAQAAEQIPATFDYFLLDVQGE